MEIKRQYIVDEQNQKIAVQLDIETFKKIEEVLENHALYEIMQTEDRDDKDLEFEEAKKFYNKLEQAK